MKIVCGFNIELWQRLGFIFELSKWFEGGEIWYAKKQFDELFFSLRINTHSGHTLARIDNLNEQKIGNHIVDEKTAIEWFGSKSSSFNKLLETLS